jgi:hypothetical protein
MKKNEKRDKLIDTLGRVLDGFELLSIKKIEEILYKENNLNE